MFNWVECGGGEEAEKGLCMTPSSVSPSQGVTKTRGETWSLGHDQRNKGLALSVSSHAKSADLESCWYSWLQDGLVAFLD